MSKKDLNEAEICDQYITPAIHAAGWDKFVQVRREYTFTDGQVIVRGKVAVRGERKRADYVLVHSPNLPLAVVEAKDNNHGVGAGMQQALDYAKTLDIPFVFSSNGDGFMFHAGVGKSSSGRKRSTSSDSPVRSPATTPTTRSLRTSTSSSPSSPTRPRCGQARSSRVRTPRRGC